MGNPVQDHSHNETPGGPAGLVSVIYLARLSGDRWVERYAKRKLEEEFGMKIIFSRNRTEANTSPR